MKTRTEQAIFVEVGETIVFNGDQYKMLPDEIKDGKLTGNCMAVNLKTGIESVFNPYSIVLVLEDTE